VARIARVVVPGLPHPCHPAVPWRNTLSAFPPYTLSILCGLAVGYPDPEFPANKLHIGRQPIGENVVFVDN
jgi:hypothetical protein